MSSRVRPSGVSVKDTRDQLVAARVVVKNIGCLADGGILRHSDQAALRERKRFPSRARDGRTVTLRICERQSRAAQDQLHGKGIPVSSCPYFRGHIWSEVIN